MFNFGGYGYFKYKNWWWEFEEKTKTWKEVLANQPGLDPYPRGGQIVPGVNKNQLILFSGIGNDTGLQREHKARGGLAIATDVGYFTWLRDMWEIDLRTMQWTNILSANHESIRHQGAFVINRHSSFAFNWAGSILSPIFGEPNEEVALLSVLNMKNASLGFMDCSFIGDTPPLSGGRLMEILNTNDILLIHEEGIWIGNVIEN